jgi:fumarate reductase subunit C
MSKMHDVVDADRRRPYVRPMAGWWRKNPFFVRYMLREGTALVVAGYAFFLLCGLIGLARGEAAYNAWLHAMESPLSLPLHVAALAGMVYHTWTWFEIMPKTMPPILINGKRVSAAVITWSGVTAAVVSTLVIFAIVRSLQP